MTNSNCAIYPVRIIIKGKVKEISVNEIRKRHWKRFEEETIKNASISISVKLIRVRAQIKRELNTYYMPKDDDE